MKIIAWNVNGIRAILKKNNLIELINEEDPDIFCIGETKINEYEKVVNEINKKLKNKYYSYWNDCTIKAGYSGTAIFYKLEPKTIAMGNDDEGRIIICEYNKFYLIHVYTPNSGELLARLKYRTDIWDKNFIKLINNLQKNKKVIVCGDLNVAHTEIDLKNPKTNLRTAGFTIEERESFDKILQKTKLIDTFRYLNPETIKYSYWSYRFKSRSKNTGWRIDYFLVDKKFIKKIKKSDILTEILGSDHAPIILEIDIILS